MISANGPDNHRSENQGFLFPINHSLGMGNSDRELLDTKISAGLTDSDKSGLSSIQAELVQGFRALAGLGPAVSVFGSARVGTGTKYYQLALDTGRRLAERGLATITGGGPGIMEAANRGASEAYGVSVGLGIELPHEQKINRWVNLRLNFSYFFVRRTMFIKYSQGFIVFPGGFGTLDELFEALVLVQTHKITSFPIILVGRDFWRDLVKWLTCRCAEEGMLFPEETQLLEIVDDVHSAMKIITQNMRMK